MEAFVLLEQRKEWAKRVHPSARERGVKRCTGEKEDFKMCGAYIKSLVI
jgi:hypothetical protein